MADEEMYNLPWRSRDLSCSAAEKAVDNTIGWWVSNDCLEVSGVIGMGGREGNESKRVERGGWGVWGLEVGWAVVY